MCQLNCGRLLYICVGIFMLMNAVNLTQCICSKVLQDNGYGNLGFYALGVMFGIFGLCSLIILPLIKKLGDRMSMIIGTISYFIYIGTQFLALLRSKYPDSWLGAPYMHTVIYVMLLVTAAMNGFGCALYWVCSIKYVNECANDKNKGLFNSIFFVFNKGSMVTGNLAAAFLIPILSELTFYMILTVLCFIMIFY